MSSPRNNVCRVTSKQRGFGIGLYVVASWYKPWCVDGCDRRSSRVLCRWRRRPRWPRAPPVTSRDIVVCKTSNSGLLSCTWGSQRPLGVLLWGTLASYTNTHSTAMHAPSCPTAAAGNSVRRWTDVNLTAQYRALLTTHRACMLHRTASKRPCSSVCRERNQVQSMFVHSRHR